MISAHGQVTLPGVVRVLVDPFVELGLLGDQGGNNYVALLGRVRDSGNSEQREFFSAFARPYVIQCIEWLREAAPSASGKQLAYAYELCTTLAVPFSGGSAKRRLVSLSQGRVWDFEAHLARLLVFVNAGVEALLIAEELR